MACRLDEESEPLPALDRVTSRAISTHYSAVGRRWLITNPRAVYFSFMRLFLRIPWNQGLRQAGVHRQRKRAMNADALGRVVDLGLGLNLPRQDECQKPRTESLPWRWCNWRPAAFHPIEDKCTADRVDRHTPGDLDPAAKDRQRAKFRRVGRDLVDRHAKRQRDLRAQGHFRPAEHNALVASVIEGIKFASQNVIEIDCALIIGEEQMRLRKRLYAA